MYTILIVDDEQGIREVLREYAEFEGHEVDEAENGFQAVEMARDKRYDIILLDVMMPKLDGFSACKEIRLFSDVPVLMLSARGEEYDKLFGFEIGADDYVVKPFSPKEMMARINVIIKRRKPAEVPEVKKEKFGGLEVNYASREVSVNGVPVDMTPKEIDLLFCLVRNKNVAMARNLLLDQVWGFDYYGDDRTIDTHIRMLRNGLQEYRCCVVTLRSMGYKFVYGAREKFFIKEAREKNKLKGGGTADEKDTGNTDES